MHQLSLFNLLLSALEHPPPESLTKDVIPTAFSLEQMQSTRRLMSAEAPAKVAALSLYVSTSTFNLSITAPRTMPNFSQASAMLEHTFPFWLLSFFQSTFVLAPRLSSPSRILMLGGTLSHTFILDESHLLSPSSRTSCILEAQSKGTREQIKDVSAGECSSLLDNRS